MKIKCKKTVKIFILTLLLSLPLGFPIALGEESKIKPLSFLCKVYVWIFRGTPLMLQLFFFYYFFPIVFGPQFALAPIPAAAAAVPEPTSSIWFVWFPSSSI